MSKDGPDPRVQAVAQVLPEARTVEEFTALVESLPAQATGENAVLFSRALSSKVYSGDVATDIADQLGWQVITNTPRGQFLNRPEVPGQLARILEDTRGLTQKDAIVAAGNLLNGLTGDEISLRESYWGRASQQFASSIKGAVLVVNPNAIPGRQFDVVELPTLESNSIPPTRINNIAVEELHDNPKALTEIRRAAREIIGADGIVALNPATAQSGPGFELTREGGARLGLSQAQLDQLRPYSKALETPGAESLQEPPERLPTLTKPQRELLDTLRSVMRERGDSERAIAMATSMAVDRMQRARGPATETVNRPPQTAVSRTPEAALRNEAASERSLGRELSR